MNMKFALAAGVCAAALAGFSDVSSANTVGYAGVDTLSGGNKVIAPMFISVSSADGTFKLSDLKGDPSTYDGETYGDLMLTVLGPGGTAEKFTDADGVPELVGQVKKFAWYDTEDQEAGWYDLNGDVAWPGDKITFKASQGFWTVGYGVRLTSAGQVSLNEVSVKTLSGGNVAIGNPFPVAIKLSNMFGDPESYDEETYGDLMLTILGPGGTAEKFTDADGVPALVGQVKKFAWYDTEDQEAGWYDLNGDVAWPADKIQFPIGQGFWTVGYGVVLKMQSPIKLN